MEPWANLCAIESKEFGQHSLETWKRVPKTLVNVKGNKVPYPHMEEQVREVLKTVETALKLHAGGIEFVSCNEQTGEVVVRLLGTCVGCGLAEITLKEGVETALVRAIPQVRSVRAVQ